MVSRHLPALGLRNRGKGVRALLSLCQQAPRSPPRPPAGRAGAPRPACLLVATLKDKRGTRYEVRGAAGAPRGAAAGGAWSNSGVGLAECPKAPDSRAHSNNSIRGESKITVFPFSKFGFLHKTFAGVKRA